ncbi:MAG: hypothetical protein SGPRY_001181 [Prymnesium sp.]
MECSPGEDDEGSLDDALFSRPPKPQGVHMVAPYEAFNVVASDSILLLDLSSNRQPSLPASAWCDTSLPLRQAAAEARNTILQTFAPDDSKTALLLHENMDRALDVAQWLLEGRCSCVRCVEKPALVTQYSFLFVNSVADLPIYPNQITNNLFLGSAASVNATSIKHLQISHVVSIVNRNMKAPAGCDHLLCRITDDEDSDLLPVLRVSIPFIAGALAAGGSVLVHCEQGVSRSVSVVCAHLIHASGGKLSLVEALHSVKSQRPCAQPNSGFLQQLQALNLTTFP